MSQETRDLALRATRGGAQGFFDLLDEYVVCDNRGFMRPDVPEVVFGREAVVQEYVRWWGTFDQYSVSAEDVIDSGRTVVVVIQEKGRGKGSAIPFDAEHTQVWTFRAGRIIHIEVFRSRDEALEAVDLAEQPMSQENVAIIEDQFAAVNERDFGRAMGHYDDDVELRVPPGIRGGTFRGREAVGDWFGEWFRTFDRDAHFDIREIREVGDDCVLVVANHRASGRGSGVGVEGIFIWSYRLREGKITHAEGFDSREEALEAVGLAE